MARIGANFAACCALALASPALAEAPAAAPATPVAPGYAMPSTATWDMTSDEGEIYRIFVSFPEVPAPEEGYPVLYVLDGNAMFAGFAETRRMLEFNDVGKTLIVGVGYPTDKAYDIRRLNDFTAAMPVPAPASQRSLANLKTGGRDRFRAFVIGKLRAEIGRRYKIHTARQALYGHSLGALFALHVLYTRPDAFHAIVAASPSLWWDDQAMLGQERDFTARLNAGKIPKVSRLLVVTGGQEEANLWDADAFAKRLEPLSAQGLRSRYIRYDDEGHMTVPIRSVPDVLRFAFAWP